MQFPIHTIATAPEASRETLRGVQASLGMIPNLAAGMAESPSLVQAFFAVRDLYARSSLSAADIQVLSLANAYENGCDWCLAFHSFAAEKAGVTRQAIDALREGGAPSDPRWLALAGLTREMIARRGHVSAETLTAFERAGLGATQALDVVLGLGFSVMANYAQHLIGAPLDEVLRRHAKAAA